MARLFASASSQYLEVDATPVTVAPLTINCWFYPINNTANVTLVAIADKDSTQDWFSIRAQGGVVGDPVRFGVRRSSSGNADTSSGYSANVWQMATGVEISAVSRASYLNAGSKGTDTTNLAPIGPDRISVGRVGDSSPGSYMGGRICQVAIWNVDLSDADVTTLYNGGVALPAWYVRPDALVAYYPLLQTDGDIDVVGDGTYDLTPVAAPTYAEHVPIVTPLPFSYVKGTETVAPAAPDFTYSRISLSSIAIGT